MGKRYKTTYTIPFYETDASHCAKISHLLSVILQVSGIQSAQLGLSDQYLLDHYGLVWVVTDYAITIDRLPVFSETIIIETEAKSYTKLFSNRETQILAQDGQKLMTISATFVLIDFETRRPAPIPKELMTIYDADFVKSINRPPKYPLLTETQDMTCPVRYFDLDMNGHVNNSKYLEWLYDAMPLDFLKEHYPKQINLKYLKEVYHGATIVSQVQLTDTTSHHQITSDGNIKAQARIEWQPFPITKKTC